MYALEIINALNDPDNPARAVKGLNAKLTPAKTAADKRTGKLVGAFDITITHADTHDGMVTISGFERDPDGSLTVSLDDFREALEADAYELSDAEPF